MPTPANPNWSNASYTPKGGKKVVFGTVKIHFPGFKPFGDTSPPEYPEDATGPVAISITTTQAGALPTFDIGQVGTFRGTYFEGADCSAVNARVILSTEDHLVLEADSLDGASPPVVHTRP